MKNWDLAGAGSWQLSVGSYQSITISYQSRVSAARWVVLCNDCGVCHSESCVLAYLERM